MDTGRFTAGGFGDYCPADEPQPSDVMSGD